MEEIEILYKKGTYWYEISLCEIIIYTVLLSTGDTLLLLLLLLLLFVVLFLFFGI